MYKKAGLYVLLAYFLSWSIFGLYFALGGEWKGPYIYLVLLPYMFMPAVAAVIVQRGIYREPVVGPLGVRFNPNWWWLAAWFAMPVVVIAALGVGLLMPGVHYDPTLTGFIERFQGMIDPAQARAQIEALPFKPVWLLWLGLVAGMIAGVTVNAVAGFGEELGWRGLLQKELAPLGFWKMSAVIGLVWGLWHAPIILQGYNYPQHPVAGVFMMTAWTLLLAPIFSYVRLKSGSVLAASVLHGTLNGTVRLAVLLLRGGSDLTVGVMGFAGFIVLAVANLCIFIFDRDL
ncbi:MAG: CPBP family intramembrane glutamic endopeptidase [Armatimonadota bacterium]